ncbi:rhomboid-like protein 20 [Typha angustifolia]|uniref:rhomboid-like protein 20 n=1 Tax=Typha angustifolia TaxID=59011 RepID=UPI003C2B0CC0
MNGGPSGFHNAPITKAIVIATALFTLPFGIHGRSLMLGLSYQDIYEKLRIWRFVSSVFAFSSTPELIFGLSLLYYFRVFERQIGSNKYLVFIVFSVIVSLLFEILTLGYLKDPSLGRLASGSYGLIFASFVPFFFDIPVSSRFRIFGVHSSDKSFIYLAGLQLLFSSWKQSLIPGMCGILAGFLYHLNTFGIRRLKFPDGATSLFSQLRWPFLSNSSQALPGGRPIGNIPSYQVRQAEGYPLPNPVTVPELSETSLATLVSMGFDNNSAREALMQARNDINVATNILLEAQTR